VTKAHRILREKRANIHCANYNHISPTPHQGPRARNRQRNRINRRRPPTNFLSTFSRTKRLMEIAETRGHNVKVARRSRIRHDYFGQRIVIYWNGMPSDVVGAVQLPATFLISTGKNVLPWSCPYDQPLAEWSVKIGKMSLAAKPKKMVNGRPKWRNFLSHEVHDRASSKWWRQQQFWPIIKLRLETLCPVWVVSCG